LKKGKLLVGGEQPSKRKKRRVIVDSDTESDPEISMKEPEDLETEDEHFEDSEEKNDSTKEIRSIAEADDAQCDELPEEAFEMDETGKFSVL
jgi:hypothetical protein